MRGEDETERSRTAQLNFLLESPTIYLPLIRQQSFCSKLPICFFLNLFSTDEYFLHLPSTPSFHSFPFYSSPLSAPPSLFSALPFPLSSSLGPPARSFPRTACSQHSPPDWLLGFKGPHAPAKHMAPLHLRPDAVVSAATSPEAAHCTHIYNSSHAAPCAQQARKLPGEHLTRSLTQRQQTGAALFRASVETLAATKDACLQDATHAGHEKIQLRS